MAVRIVLFALAWRVYSSLLAFYANVVFPLHQPEQFTVYGRTHLFWDPFARYDSGWYFGIARYGYEFVESGRSNIAFFPVYPTLMGWLGHAFGGGRANYYFAGIAISWAAFTAAMVLLYRLARFDLPDDRAALAAVYTAIFPFAFFFGKVYPESLFLLFALLAFYWLRQGRWLLGGLAGGFMTATRANGVVGVAGLVWLALRPPGPARWRIARTAAVAALSLGGVGLYSLHVYLLSGSPLAWADAISRWGYYPGAQAPWASLVRLVTNLTTQPYAYLTTIASAPYDTLNGLAALWSSILVPLVAARLGAAYGLFMLFHLAVPLSSGEYEGLGRYCSVLFPASIYLASLRSRTVAIGLLVAFATLYMLGLALFVNIHPVF